MQTSKPRRQVNSPEYKEVRKEVPRYGTQIEWKDFRPDGRVYLPGCGGGRGPPPCDVEGCRGVPCDVCARWFCTRHVRVFRDAIGELTICTECLTAGEGDSSRSCSTRSRAN